MLYILTHYIYYYRIIRKILVGVKLSYKEPNLLIDLLKISDVVGYNRKWNWIDWNAYISKALQDLAPFTLFKKRKKHPWRSVTFSKVAESACNFTKSNNRPRVFFMFLKLYNWYQIAQSVTYSPSIRTISVIWNLKAIKSSVWARILFRNMWMISSFVNA